MSRGLSTAEVARKMGVAVNSVISWIDQGLLPAGRTPGGHRRVKPEDLGRFLRRQSMPVPPGLETEPPTILVVDDEAALAKWLGEEFREYYPDSRVLEAYDGFTAGELVALHRPDLVILDLRMPGVDGFEVCRRIREQRDMAHAVIVAMTAYHSPETEQRILACGANAYLTKPAPIESFFPYADAVLGARRQVELASHTV